MSSFVISKVEYIKAAGFVAGIVKESKTVHFTANIRLWDAEQQREMNTRDIHAAFEKCYELNAANVYEYYSPNHPDEELATDSDAYNYEFTQYMTIGRKMYHNPEKLRKAIFNLRDFFGSACYQTAENDEYYNRMESFLNRILVAVMGPLYPHECECWGKFNVQ